MGGDDSHAGGWRLRRLHKSKKIFNQLTRIVQNTKAEVVGTKKKKKKDKDKKKGKDKE